MSNQNHIPAAPLSGTGRPGKQGLYDPWFEHDACGVGFIVDMKGRKSHKMVADGLQILRNLDHRGASGAEINTAQVPASKAPEIVFDRATLPVRDSYRIEVVTASGSQVYSGTPAMDASTLTGRVPKRLGSGRYWARVYSGGDLLKESGFEVVP